MDEVVLEGVSDDASVATWSSSLPRNAVARCRFIGALEWLSFVVLFVVALIANDLLGSGSMSVGDWLVAGGASAVAAGSIAVRIAVATEYVRADSRGVAWRSLFRTSSMQWGEVASIETDRIQLFGDRAQSVAIAVHASDGRVVRLRASVWCPHIDSWIAQVRRLHATGGVEDPATFVLSGFVTAPAAGARPDWLPTSSTFVLREDAVRAAQNWLIDYPHGVVQVMKSPRDTGEIVCTVTTSGVEDRGQRG